MGKIKSVFIVLHYNEKAIADTIECIESIQTAFSNRDDFKIIVVENGSGDNSGVLLETRYKNDALIEVIISQENLGFARGNNLGCRRAIELYQPQFLIVINNDTIIKQKEFLDKLYARYNKESFDVLGPFIYDRNLLPQNPQLKLRTTVEEIENSILENYKILNQLDDKLNGLKVAIRTGVKKIIQLNTTLEKNIRKIIGKEITKIEPIMHELKNVGLHGSALIFTQDYYEKYPEVFYPKTFMFVEEDILLYRVLSNNLKSIYYPEIEIYHKEDRSTDATLTSTHVQNRFKIKHIIDSLEIYKELILNENKID